MFYIYNMINMLRKLKVTIIAIICIASLILLTLKSFSRSCLLLPAQRLGSISGFLCILADQDHCLCCPAQKQHYLSLSPCPALCHSGSLLPPGQMSLCSLARFYPRLFHQVACLLFQHPYIPPLTNSPTLAWLI